MQPTLLLDFQILISWQFMKNDKNSIQTGYSIEIPTYVKNIFLFVGTSIDTSRRVSI